MLFLNNMFQHLIKCIKGFLFMCYTAIFTLITHTRISFSSSLYIGTHAHLILARGARILKYAFIDIRKKATLHIGRGSLIGRGCEIIVDETASCYIGDNVSIGSFSNIRCNKKIEIGSGTLIAQFVSIIGGQYKYKKKDIPIVKQGFTTWDVIIGKNVWIGAGVMILPNSSISIGDGAVIAAGSIVTTNIPEYAIAGGRPAKVAGFRE
ncbi:MAG: acyltransferase [bacterium]|nr:acyltransferase [bacterium]